MTNKHRKTKQNTPSMERTDRCQSYFEIAPEEALTGYLLRMALAGKITNLRGALDYGADATNYSLGRDSWSFTPRIRDSFNGKHELFSRSRAIEVVKKHTLEPLVRHVNELSYARLLELSISTERLFGERKHDKYLVERGFMNGQVALFCETCFEEQVSSVGFSYYRLRWQLPMVAYCDVHGTPLRRIACADCGLRPSRADCFARLKERRCGNCNTDTWRTADKVNNPRRALFHKWFVALLDADIPPFSHELRKVIKSEAFDRRCKRKEWYLVDEGSFTEVIRATGERAHRKIATKTKFSDGGREFRHFRHLYTAQDDFYWFWLPIIDVFPVFEEFQEWLKKNSIPRTERVELVDADVTYLSRCN